MTKDQLLERFLRESNAIEDEFELGSKGALYDYDLAAAKKFLDSYLDEDSVKTLHHDLSEGRDILRGDYRKYKVQVGNHVPPAPALVHFHMDNFFADLDELDAWQAHNRFEWIHPFEDLNGRTGRLIWLHKLGKIPDLSFLQTYYYQTLDHVSSF